MSPSDSKLQFYNTSATYICSYCLALCMHIRKSLNCRQKPTTTLPCFPLFHEVYNVLQQVYYDLHTCMYWIFSSHDGTTTWCADWRHIIVV